MTLLQLCNDYQRDDVGRKREVLERLLDELSRHEEAEEAAFYPAIADVIPMGDALVSRRLREQAEARKALRQIATAITKHLEVLQAYIGRTSTRTSRFRYYSAKIASEGSANQALMLTIRREWVPAPAWWRDRP